MVSEDLIERADQNKSWLQPSLNHPFYFENENPAIHGKQFQNNTHTISLYYQDAIQEANVSENLFKQITKPLIFQLKKFDQSDDLDIYGQEFEYIDINIYGREFKKKFREQLLEEDSEHLSPFIEDGQHYRHADVIDLVFPSSIKQENLIYTNLYVVIN